MTSIRLNPGNVRQILTRGTELYAVRLLGRVIRLLQQLDLFLHDEHITLEDAQAWERKHIGGSHSLFRTIGPADGDYSLADAQQRRWELLRDLTKALRKYESSL